MGRATYFTRESYRGRIRGGIMKINSQWIVQAINAIKSGLAQKLEKGGVTVYSCGKIIRIDIKETVEVEE